jgi:TonB family protein
VGRNLGEVDIDISMTERMGNELERHGLSRRVVLTAAAQICWTAGSQPRSTRAMDGAGFESIASRRPSSVSPGSILSVVIHAGVLLLVFVIARDHAIDRPAPPPVAELISIDVVDPQAPRLPPPPSPRPGTLVRSNTNASVGVRGRRGHDAQRSPRAPDPTGDLVVSYELGGGTDPGSKDGTEGPRLGTGLLGIGLGGGDDGPLGNGLGAELKIPPAPPPPPPPVPSRARPPRPAGDYSRWHESDGGQFAGEVVVLELTIDPEGSVHDVRLVRAVDPDIDKHAISLARTFEFYPALADDGVPTWSRYRWEFEVRADFARHFRFGGF